MTLREIARNQRRNLVKTLKRGMAAIADAKAAGAYPSAENLHFLSRWGDVVRFYERCWYCGTPLHDSDDVGQAGETLRTIDHLVPLARGGTNSPENVVYCCNECNHSKDAMTVHEFRARLFAGGHRFYGERTQAAKAA